MSPVRRKPVARRRLPGGEPQDFQHQIFGQGRRVHPDSAQWKLDLAQEIAEQRRADDNAQRARRAREVRAKIAKAGAKIAKASAKRIKRR